MSRTVLVEVNTTRGPIVLRMTQEQYRVYRQTGVARGELVRGGR